MPRRCRFEVPERITPKAAVRAVAEEIRDRDALDVAVAFLHALFLSNVRNVDERRADLRALLAATDRAEAWVGELHDEHGCERFLAAFDAVIDSSHDRMAAELADDPDGTYEGSDVLEGDGVSDADLPISVTVDGPRVTVDFAGTTDQVTGNMNASIAVARSANYFVVRAVTDPKIPPNHGCYEPVTVTAPEGAC